MNVELYHANAMFNFERRGLFFYYVGLGQTASSQSNSAVHWRVGGGITT